MTTNPISGHLYTLKVRDERVFGRHVELSLMGDVLECYRTFPPRKQVLMFLEWIKLNGNAKNANDPFNFPYTAAKCLVGDKIVFLATTRGRGWVPLEFVPLDKDQSSI